MNLTAGILTYLSFQFYPFINTSFLSSTMLNFYCHKSISSADVADSLGFLTHATKRYAPLLSHVRATGVIFQ